MKRLAVFATHDAAKLCLSSMNGKTLCDRTILISPSNMQYFNSTLDSRGHFPTNDELKSLFISGKSEMKSGDWLCDACQFHNFAYRSTCHECGKIKATSDKHHRDTEKYESSPDSTPSKPNASFREGDWVCPDDDCAFINYVSRTSCLKCHAQKPGLVLKDSEWVCSQPTCSFLNYSTRSTCFKCGSAPAPPSGKPGDWACPNCQFHNFVTRTSCLKCYTPNPVSRPMVGGDWICPKPTCEYLPRERFRFILVYLNFILRHIS
jgi:hypothetical protein